MYSVVKETFRKEIFGEVIERKLQYYIVYFNSMYYSLSEFDGDIDTDKDGMFSATDANFRYLITCAPTQERVLYLTRKVLTGRIIKEVKDTIRENNIENLMFRRVKNLRDGICYHMSKSIRRENIDIKGLLPGSYEDESRLFIDRTIDDLREHTLSGEASCVSREGSVFLYPTLSASLITGKSEYAFYDLYAVTVDTSRIWLAPSKINDMLTFNYNQTSLELDDYFSTLRNLGRLYWESSFSAGMFDFTNPLIDYEALAYSDESILDVKRIAMFNEEGFLYPLDNYNFFVN